MAESSLSGMPTSAHCARHQTPSVIPGRRGLRCRDARLAPAGAAGYAGFRPQPAQDFPTRTRHWIDTHTDQVIIIVSLVLGFWLVTTSIYYIVT